ncbi:MAG TPA: HD domain-containing phosphohydrolase [Planctomycetaceae bacterium]|nr:HD domain-containing phosphohydrolase [Planctomycetaceae bacterium]
MNILIADDDDVTREIALHQLLHLGHHVQTASDGEEAWDQIVGSDLDVAILDWDMPGWTGPELCRRIRESDREHYLYVMLLTARNRPEHVVQGLRSGADAFVTKPIGVEELTARIEVAERMLAMETRDVAIFALARLAESRDPETGQHLERVRTYARALAQEMADVKGLGDHVDGEFIRLIYATSPLHDIGKVGIPDAVLLKPGKLTPDEFTVMKRHAMIGAETLDAAFQKFPRARFLQMACEIAASHHERWDGTGYPRGLRGNDIPLSARIVSVADVYDALTSKRVYKDAFTHDNAVQIIREGAGTQFDTRLVAAFLRIADGWQRISAELRDPVEAELVPA